MSQDNNQPQDSQQPETNGADAPAPSSQADTQGSQSAHSKEKQAESASQPSAQPDGAQGAAQVTPPQPSQRAHSAFQQPQQAPTQQWQPPRPQPQQHQAGWQAPPAGQMPYTGQVPPAGQAPYGWQAAGAYAPPAPPKKRGWIVALVAVVLTFVLIAMGIGSCTAVLTSSVDSVYGTTSSADMLSEDAVAVITLDGTIQYDGSACSPEGFKYLLDEAEENPYIRAVVLRVNSGGGTATAGEEMAEYLKDFSKPVVVSSASLNASAAYEISSQADYIYVAKSTEIGAIGTAMQITDTSELFDMLGINVETITSADSKDSSYGTRPLTDEERAYYQRMVDQINEAFLENVADGRNMSMEEVRALATGLVFTGIDAVDNGLADEIGTREDAMDKAAELAGLHSYTVISLDPSYDDLSYLIDLLAESSASGNSLSALTDAIKELEEDGTLE